MLLDFLTKVNSDPGLIYISIRTVIIFIYAILLIRFGNKRFHFKTIFDYILFIILGSLLSRGIDGSATLIATLLVGLIFILLHRLCAYFAFKSHKFGKLIKGNSLLVIQDGVLNCENLRKVHITVEDLQEVCREQLHHNQLEKIQEARLERTGQISFIPKEK